MHNVMSQPLPRSLFTMTAVCALAAMLLLSGCKPGRDSTSQNPTKSQEESESLGDRCDDLLNSAIDQLQPDRLDISSNREAAVSLLNTWLSGCGSKADVQTEMTAEQRSLLDPILSAAEIERIAEQRFSLRDGTHVRDSILLQKMIDQAGGSGGSDLERVVNAFDFTIRNVALAERDPLSPPLSPYFVLLTGRGLPEDRAWIFSGLLRQMGIDSVILRPASGENPAWLMGVLLDGNVYLFDPKLGLPIPSADESPSASVRQPATLADVRENPALVAGLPGGAALSAEALADLRVELIGSTSLWSMPMKALQMFLTGDRSAVVSDSLTDSETGPGVLPRVAQAGEGIWSAEDIGVWPHPEQQLEAVETPTDEQKGQLAGLLIPLSAPVPISTEQERLGFGPPQNSQMQTRTLQLLGEYSEAVPGYLTIRLAAQRFLAAAQQATQMGQQFPQELIFMHARAHDDAYYWGAVAKFEQGDYETAEDILREYLFRLKANGLWYHPARHLRAECLVRLGKVDDAVRLLQRNTRDDPQQARAEILTDRWRQLSSAPRS